METLALKQTTGVRTLVYKMTHLGDPNPRTRIWGWRNCMGRVRGYEYEAVIGIGGVSADDGIVGKIVWIGIGPKRRGDPQEPELTFDKFLFLGRDGPAADRLAPALARHLYDGRARYLLNLSPTEQREAARLLALTYSASGRSHLPPERARRCSRSRAMPAC